MKGRNKRNCLGMFAEGTVPVPHICPNLCHEQSWRQGAGWNVFRMRFRKDRIALEDSDRPRLDPVMISGLSSVRTALDR